MNASQQQLQRLIQLYRLRDLYILKDNIGLEFNHMHYNKPARKIDHVFNKALKEEIANVVDGTGSNVKTVKELKNIIPEALKQQQKTLVKNPDRFINHAVKSNSKDYGKILQNRVKKETHGLTAKIEQERIKTTYEGLLDNKLKKELYRNLKGKVAARPKNIVKDALHTNQSNIGFIKALNEGYLYKEWMNGRKIMMRGGTKKSRTRPWHRASIIDTVPVDEYFDIYGSYHAQLMYPGDLNGGAENVANCRCWSRYTNTKPTGMSSKGNGGTKTLTGKGNVQSFTDLWKQKLTAKSNGSSKRSKSNSKLKELRVNNDNYDRTKVYFEEKPKNNKTSKKDKQSITTKIKNKITSLTSKTKDKFKEIKSYLNENKNNLRSRLNKNQVEELKKEYYDYTKAFNRNVEKAQKILKQLYPLPKLIPNEKRFLVEWGIDSGSLNEYLRELYEVSSSQEMYFNSYIKHLNNGINKFNNIKHKTMLHRRVSNDFYIVDVGEIGIFETPISTSFNDYAIKKKNYGDFHITILAPTGSNGAYLEEFMKKYDHDNHDHEEWLLPINTPYKTLYKNYKTKEAVIILTKLSDLNEQTKI